MQEPLLTRWRNQSQIVFEELSAMRTSSADRSKQFVLWIAVFLLAAGGFLRPTTAQTINLRRAVPPIPCSARAYGIIANTGNVDSLSGSLVDSYRSAHGSY